MTSPSSDLPREKTKLREELALEVVPVTAEHAHLAREAYRDYGRGSSHPANLNDGDCFSYALASERRQPLL
ncbi:type II toxin-antitoxin system VapC family toxin [Microbacterium rhizomatis]|uniref:Type II toxin-antitoxin system VapC family toxin n=1 Tax=Microbacterium rhizomatis TaxID=1631477 RepID=A0A5J5IYL4_9MICO|nr:type II toxin-antitoxin system VapC family toxin [Microbacterium rhizomatis]KAA9106535.1 type II toxin-antitoxin system VapC family toxin [Microbacterium rhizomatis]